MPVTQDRDKLLVWGSNMEEGTIQQALRSARLPFVEGHVSLMADGHIGIGGTVGSVVPTKGAVVPALAGVDLGCGMVATRTSLCSQDLPDDLEKLMPKVEERIPAGLGKSFTRNGTDLRVLDRALTDPRCAQFIGLPQTELDAKQRALMVNQFGTLGSGNHFVEVCVDEVNNVWTVLHSGSRGIGNQLARHHIEKAKGLMKEFFIKLEDPDLAYLVEGTSAFDHYIRDMLWAQKYAYASREEMNKALLHSLFELVGYGVAEEVINCHHNYTEREHFPEGDLWITRKGAIRARKGDKGVIPGSMGTNSYIVSGLGSEASWNSCSHGAGRRMSRGQAKRELDPALFQAQMAGITWNESAAGSLLDEAPNAYKSIQQVMADQADLCQVEAELHQVFNYKGTSEGRKKGKRHE